jgi:hypothetical protein
VSPLAVAGIVFGCVFGGALFGMFLRTRLPAHHLGPETKDLVKLGVGLIGTMSALVLGLLVASAKGSYDTQRSELIQMSAKVIVLDRVLAHYGTEAKETRDLLRHFIVSTLDRMWPSERSGAAQLKPFLGEGEALYERLQALAPQNDAQRSLQAQALSIAMDVGQTRSLMFQQTDSSISTPLLVVVVCWLAIIFASFGLFAQPNGLAISVLVISALSVSAAIFLILELDQPFNGLIRMSSGPLRSALAQLGR